MVAELVGRARRRYLWNELLAQGAWAVSAALSAVIVLLLVGTEILDWQWLVLLPVATLAYGIWRTFRRLPPPYTVAQAVDHRLKLTDSLSTALYFGSARAGRWPEEVREAQRLQAERLSENVDVRQAVPLTMPRAIYSVAILGVAASSLFALRYGIEDRLDLRKPLASIIQQAFGLDQQQAAALDRQKPPSPPRKQQDPNEMEALALSHGEDLPEGKLEGVQSIDASGSPAEPKPAERTAGNQEGGMEGDEMAGEDGQEVAGISTGNQEGREGQGQSGEGKQSASRGGNGEPGENSSLMDKFREAMQNLMSRMRPPSTGSQGAQQARQNAQQGQQQAGASQSGQQQGEQQSGEGQGQEGRPGGESQTAENATGRGNGKSGNEDPSRQPGGGIGQQDGDKDLRSAEQLAAMGKISEIIGKRAANVSGEVTVEVQSSSQQLQTAYSQRRATSGETVAEISRDEVPVALESYVQQYFEQVRKVPGAKR